MPSGTSNPTWSVQHSPFMLQRNKILRRRLQQAQERVGTGSDEEAANGAYARGIWR